MKIILGVLLALLLVEGSTAAKRKPRKGTCYPVSEVRFSKPPAWFKRRCSGSPVTSGVTRLQCLQSTGKCWVPDGGDVDNGKDGRGGTCWTEYDEVKKECAGVPIKHRNGAITHTEYTCQCNGGKCMRYAWDNPPVDGKIDTNEPIIERRLQEGECDVFAGGEPHLKTWRGEWYDYMGECDLVLIHAPQLDLDIHIRTKIRYNYSFITSAAVRLGDSILEVAGWGDYFLNGVASAETGNTQFMISGYKVTHSNPDTKSHVFDIELDDENHILVKTFKDWVSVKIESWEDEYFDESRGLLGDYLTGAKLSRDGMREIDDPNEFGQEWQVRDTEPMFFQSAAAPQYPEKCKLPATDALQTARRLGETIKRDSAEKACAHWDKSMIKACIYDVMTSGDIEMAEAGGY